MPTAAKKELLPETSPFEEHDDDFDFGSLDDLASLMVEALTIPLAADLSGSEKTATEDLRQLPSKAKN